MSDDGTTTIDVTPTKDSIRETLDQLIVKPAGGALIATFGQQIDYAKYMSRGNVALPSHLQGNVGACLAVVDIATRFGFSPYMVANQTYVQSDRLCFMAQLVHAMIEGSGLLQGRLRATWDGEGDDRTCTVIGLIKGEKEPHKLTSRPLGDLRPENVTKISKGEEKTFVRGSPLWEKKPDVQLFYNTSRDWARLWLPEVLMGIYTPDEIADAEEHRGPDNAVDRGTITALKDVPAAGIEGGTADHIDTELENVAAAAGGTQEAGSVEGDVDPSPAEKRTTAPESEPTVPPKGKTRKAKAKASKELAEPAAAKEPEPAKPAKLPAKPKTIPDWKPYALAHIAAAGAAAELRKWWEEDRKLRNALGITADERVPVENIYQDKIDELKDAGK